MKLQKLFRREIPKQGNRKNEGAILILFALSLVFFLLARFIPSKQAEAAKSEMLGASKTMAEALTAIRECRHEKGLAFDESSDPNLTGLIGLEYSPITTSIGSLEAKRTTTNPNFAALVVFLLRNAGAKKGDAIAVGASSSFPAVIVAVLSAAKAMGLRAVVISSLGASQWGANDPRFHWLDIQDCLSRAGVFNTAPIALSLGGDKDRGEDMSPEGRSLLMERIRKSGIFFIDEPDLRRNVETRMSLFEAKAGEGKIKAFVNVGGSWPNMGEDSEVLKLKPGLIKIKEFPADERRGILYEMALRKVPVVHLLYIKGLVERYGFPWNPSPLPEPGQGRIYELVAERQKTFLYLAVSYFLLLIFVFIFKSRFVKLLKKLRPKARFPEYE
jgi:poly-gamma-glutamate system protein